MSYDNYGEQRLAEATYNEINSDPKFNKYLDREILKNKINLKILKIKNKANKIENKANKIASKTVNHLLKTKLKGKQFKKQPTATVSIPQREIADFHTDKKRFFKEEFEEDRRALFFA